MKVEHVNPFGDDAEFDHIGLAVNSIEEVFPNGIEKVTDTLQRVSVAFILLNKIRVELIEPYGENSPITANLKKMNKLVHMCYRVPDMDAAIKTAKVNGFRCIEKPVPAKAFNDKKISWLFSKHYGLVELLEM